MIFKEFLDELRGVLDKYEPMIEDRMYLDDEHTMQNHNHVRPSYALRPIKTLRTWIKNNWGFFAEADLSDYYPLIEDGAEHWLKIYEENKE